MEKRNSKKLYVLGSINADLAIDCDELPEKGETILGQNFEVSLGGKGANQAYYASVNKLKTYLIGCIGDDFYSKFALNSLKKTKIDLSKIRVVEKNIGVAVIIRSKNDNQIILDKGANHSFNIKDLNDDIDGQSGDSLLVQYEIPYEIVLEGLKIAKAKGMTTYVNASPAHYGENEIYKYIDYLVINETETYKLSKINPDNEKNILIAAEFFLKLGVKNVIITLGPRGCFYYNYKKVINQKAFPTNVVDTTGAGDSFLGTLIAGINKNLSMEQAIKKACATSSYVCRFKGAQIENIDFKEIEKISKEVKKHE